MFTRDEIMELSSDAFEILMPDELEKIQKFFALVIKVYQKHVEHKADDALEAVDKDMTAGVEIEALAQQMKRLCQQFQTDTGLFSQDYRKQFLEVFFTENPDIRRTPKVYNTVNRLINACFDELEAAAKDKYSDGERVILRQEMLTQSTLYSISRNVLDIHGVARDNNDRLRDIQSRLSPAPAEPSTTLHTSNADYAAWFQKPLFLHDGKNDAVNLTNLFVKHKFEVKRGNSVQTTVDGYLADFLHGKEPFLFIEGDAGSGKTSLTQYMSYHYERRDDTAQQIFGNTRLITVRLREIDHIPTDCRPEQRLTRAILRFLYENDRDNDNLKRFQKSGARVLWLDGYDELCTMEGIDNPQTVLWPLESLGCKIVVTSRPNYIRFDWSKKYCHIVLTHFDKEQRQEWLKNYETKCGETLGAVNRRYLERVQSDNDAVGICDTPMGLYMVAAGRFTEAMLENEWALYYQIFHEEIKDTPYNKPFGGFGWQHPTADDWESLYRVSEEIAWYLYRNKNADLLVSYETVDAIIDGLGLQGDKEQLVKRCFALCGYWNTRTKQGCVEFYHNNIRDFFLCEKIMRELNQAYQDHQKYPDFLSFLQCICQLFQYDNLEKRVLEFLGQRASYAPGICVETEKVHHNTIRIFETLLMSGKLYFIFKKQQEKENPVEIVARVMRNTVGVYRYLYEAFLSDGDLIYWWEENNINTVNRNTTFRGLCGEILHFAGSSSLLEINLLGADLRGADLRGADLRNADLRGAILQSADLCGADLCGADLHGVHLEGTNLHGADLHGVHLEGTNLHRADLSNANLHQANLKKVNLQGANLQGANLQDANLQGANLRRARTKKCNMKGINGIPIMY